MHISSAFNPSFRVQSLKQNAQSAKFAGRREDALFSQPVYSGNPFLTRKEQIEKSQRYQDVVTKWEKDTQGNLIISMGKIGARHAGAAVGHVVDAHISGLPTAVPEIIGNIASDLLGRSVEPVVKRFTRPELERQKLVAEEYAHEIGLNGKVGEACGHIKKNMNEGYFIWFNKENHIGQFLKGLISRYGCEQGRVKSILPDIKGKYRTRDVMVPVLERCKNAPLYINREVGGSWTGDQEGFVYEDFASNPIGKAISSINDGVLKEAEAQIIPSGDLYKRMFDEEDATKLRRKLPAVIEYLQD